MANDFFLVLPELILLTGACALLIADLFVKSADRRASFIIAQCVLLGCAVATVLVLGSTPLPSQYAFHRLFVADMMSHLLKLAAYGSVSLVLVYSRQYLLDRGLLRGEYLTLLLFALLGMMVMMSANSFLTMYLGLELLSLCLYALVALNRDSAASTEAAMKYFVLGALASGMLLYGMSMIYGATGSLTLNDVLAQIGNLSKDSTQHTFLVFGLVFMVSGIAFKLGVVPFHMWIPDVYHGAPTAVTLVIGTAPKLAAFAMAMRLLVGGLGHLAADWQQMLAILAVLSMALGNITAIAQSNLKRMLAYSTIAHMGFMLLGLGSGMVSGNFLNAPDAWAAAMFYTVVYVLMSLGSFGLLVFLSGKGFECENLDDLKGLSKRNPWYAFLVLLLMFSLAGVPPTVGFYAKLAVLSAAVNAGQIWLAVIAVLFSLVGAYYYLRIVKLMYFDEPKDDTPFSGQSWGPRVLLSANGLALLALGLLPQPLMSLCFVAIKNLSKFKEERISGEVVYAGKFFKVYKDQVRLPDGTQAVRDYLRHPGAVAMVVLTDKGEVVLERQHRYPLGRDLVEIPAGKLEEGEDHLETGKRELLEETGYAAANWTRLGLIHNAIGYSDEGIELWLATGLTQGEAKLDQGEFLEVFTLPFDEALAMAADGRISDVKTIIGLFWANARR